MITPNDFKEGLVFEDDKGRRLQVIAYQRHRKSQSKAKVVTKVRDVDSGAVLERSYPSETKLREVDVRKRNFQFLYADGDSLHFMDNESYEQVALPKERLGKDVKYLVENLELIGVYMDDKFRSIELPPNVKVKISYSEPGVKGDSVSNLTKTATVENGFDVKVPLFIHEGDVIKIDTRTGQYLERVKE